jgi:hypothetical protein
MEIVNRHVGQLQLNRTIWRETRLMLDANPRINGLPFYFHWITEQYHVAQAIGVRRQLDSAETHQQTLGRLLTLLEGGAEQITRDWFMGMYSSQPQMQEIGQQGLLKLWFPLNV